MPGRFQGLIFAGLIALAVAALPARAAVEADGAFWQPNSGMVSGFTDEGLAAEVHAAHEAGFRTIILQYSGYWDAAKGGYVSYWPNDVFPVDPAFASRDPLGAILNAAQKNGMNVILGGLLMRDPEAATWKESVRLWTAPDAMAFRASLLKRYGNHPALAGWYTPNEFNPYLLKSTGCDPAPALAATRDEVRLVRKLAPKLTIVHSIGLYRKVLPDGSSDEGPIEDLEQFWRPWVAALPEVDVWMVIDGVGTRLSELPHSERAQAWAKQLSHEYGKKYWTNVENAVMDGATYRPFSIGELTTSLQAASRYADRIVIFDYLHYMSQKSPKEDARRLHQDYLAWRGKTSAKAPVAASPELVKKAP